MNEMFPPLVGYQSQKAAQMTAYFGKQTKGRIEKLKVIKLLYLAERDFMAMHARPMLYDEFYSLKEGPILAATLRAIDGTTDGVIWDDYIARNGKTVFLVKRVERGDFTEISDTELATLERTWSMFGELSAGQMRDHVFAKFPECRQGPVGRFPITYSDVFKALGFKDAEALALEVENFRLYESAFTTAE